MNISLPLSRHHQQHAEDASAEDQQRYTEQVRILPLDALPNQREEHIAEVLPLTAQTERFRIFQIKALSTQGRALLLQILRMYPATKVEQLRLSDELAFMLEFRRAADAPEVSAAEHTHLPATLIPGLNSIVIFLDEAGTPTDYSIDGVKS